jgi:LmbE family N-acetylglucosaminyl deacetylase
MKGLFIFMAFLLFNVGLPAQNSRSVLYKVMTLTGGKSGSRDIAGDHSIGGMWQKLLKLKTIASIMHTQAHPDDEHADLLTSLGRGKGVRTSLLSLTRGESGGNILGVEFFDQLALLRTEEFLLAGSYYGLDDLYFTNLLDYGFSKRVEEAYKKWGRQNVLAEMVRVIRINRPLVIISRFHGTKRDGHGNHQAVGEITPEAYRLAGDPNAFPEQINKEGLRPWKVLKLYRGGIKADEHWNIALNTGEFSPWLGDSYKNYSLFGYSFHRSQFGGQRNQVNGSFIQYYERLHTHVKTGEKEGGFFEGIDVSINGIFKITGEEPPKSISVILNSIQKEVDNALTKFKPDNPTQIIPFLTKGLTHTRAAIGLLKNQADALFILKIKERQFMDAINTILGISMEAIAMPAEAKESLSFYAPPPTMGFVVPGQSFKVRVRVTNRNAIPITPGDIKIIGKENWQINSKELNKSSLEENEKTEQAFSVTVPYNVRFTQPYYHRSSLHENQYQYDNNEDVNLADNRPALQAAASYLVQNVLVEIQTPVMVNQPNLPYGYNQYILKLAPAIAVNVFPKMGVIPINGLIKDIDVQVELINNYEGINKGELRLNLPAGWQVQTPTAAFTFTKAGEKANFFFKVNTAALTEKNYELKAIATVNNVSYTQGYSLSTHRDLDETIMYQPAVCLLKAIDLKINQGLEIGYVMGVGDEVPSAIRQLGASVQLLTSDDLAKANLDQFDAIMIGTRAYAVRNDLAMYNLRLLDFARNGGHLIVLFQTPEFVPHRMAPYPAELPNNPEEVSEEDSPVKILDNNHPVLNFPNKITTVDFDNWVEQRGSKFFSKWDSIYTPIISTNDVGQSPQSGGWLMAPYGRGNYTYFAYSFHRQLPYGVTGAYRILANLLSYKRN